MTRKWNFLVKNQILLVCKDVPLWGISLCYISLSSRFFCFSRFSKNLLPPIMFLRFLLLLHAKIGGWAKIFFNFGSTCKICQFFPTIVLRSGGILLYVTVSPVSRKRSVLDVLILFRKSFLGTEIARLICFVVSFLL